MRRKTKLEKRIEMLEAEIAALKARPAIQYHYHYPQPQYLYPTYLPMPIYTPPIQPWVMPTVTCTSGYAQVGNIADCTSNVNMPNFTLTAIGPAEPLTIACNGGSTTPCH